MSETINVSTLDRVGERFEQKLTAGAGIANGSSR